MYTTVAQLISAFRSDMQDNAAPYLWSDTELVRYVNEGLVRLYSDVRSLTTTVSVAMDANQTVFRMPDELMTIVSGHVVPPGATQGDLADVVTYSPDERRSPFYKGRTATIWVNAPRPVGEPQGEYAKVSPVYSDDYSIVLTGTARYPVMASSTSTLPTRYEENIALMAYVKYLALMKQDAETFDKTRAQEMFLLYRDTADRLYSITAKRTRPAGVTRYGGL